MAFSIGATAQEAITNRCLAETSLRDWRGFDESYSSEKAHKLIFEPEFRLFRDGLLWAAGQVGRKRLITAPPMIHTAETIDGVVHLTIAESADHPAPG